MPSSPLDKPPYTPLFAPPVQGIDLQQVENWTKQELDTLARLFSAQPGILYTPNNVAPARPRTGMTVYADGVNWNPGFGAGLYVYSGGIWVPISSYSTGTWTPVDASGAGLTFTSTSGRYTKIDNMVFARGSATYPATADGSTAIIGGLPFTNTGLVSPNPLVVSGTLISTSDYIAYVQASASNFLVAGMEASTHTNAQLSGRTTVFNLTYGL